MGFGSNKSDRSGNFKSSMVMEKDKRGNFLNGYQVKVESEYEYSVQITIEPNAYLM